jgi:hypothetical protein
MAKTISDEKFKEAAHLVDAVLQPMLKQIVEKANAKLKVKGIRIALDARWAFDEIASEDKDG